MSDRTNIQENVQPFQFYVADDVLEAITERVATYPWHEMPNDGGWDYGTNMDYLKELCAYWVNEFDWRAQEKRLNSFSHFIAPIDDIKMHFIYEQGSGDAPMPLMISHGWPGSVAEFFNLIEPLAHPERFGGDPRDSFTVIAPSLPGFGFSGRPPRPYGPRKMAAMINKLMTKTLGFQNYLAQMPTIHDSKGSRLAYLSSLREVAIINTIIF